MCEGDYCKHPDCARSVTSILEFIFILAVLFLARQGPGVAFGDLFHSSVQLKIYRQVTNAKRMFVGEDVRSVVLIGEDA